MYQLRYRNLTTHFRYCVATGAKASELALTEIKPVKSNIFSTYKQIVICFLLFILLLTFTVYTHFEKIYNDSHFLPDTAAVSLPGST